MIIAGQTLLMFPTAAADYLEYERFHLVDAIKPLIQHSVMKIVGSPDQFRKHSSLGFGLWMDNDWRTKGWDEKDFSKNYFTPEQFEASVAKAMATGDDYVWIYTETPRWWAAAGGKPEKLPAEYDQAVHRAAAAAAAAVGK